MWIDAFCSIYIRVPESTGDKHKAYNVMSHWYTTLNIKRQAVNYEN